MSEYYLMKAKIFSHLVRPLHPPRVFPWRHNWKSLHLKQLLFSFVCSSLLFSSLLSSFPSAKSAFSINLHFQPPLFLRSLSLSSLRVHHEPYGIHHCIFTVPRCDIAVSFFCRRAIDLARLFAPEVTGRAPISIRAAGKVSLQHWLALS